MKKITLRNIALAAILLVGLIFQSGSASAQQDSITRLKLDSLIKLSNHQIKLLDPKKTEAYISLQEKFNSAQSQNQRLVEGEKILNDKLKAIADENLKLMTNLADCRLSSEQVEDISGWSKAQGIDTPTILNLTIQISQKLDETDLLFTKSPDNSTLKKIYDNSEYFKQNMELVNQKSQIYKEMSKYKVVVSDYFKYLQEFDAICKEVSPKFDNSTISDIVRIFRRDLSYYPYLRGAFYFASEYSAPYAVSDNFFWFLDNDVQIPSK